MSGQDLAERARAFFKEREERERLEREEVDALRAYAREVWPSDWEEVPVPAKSRLRGKIVQRLTVVAHGDIVLGLRPEAEVWAELVERARGRSYSYANDASGEIGEAR